MNYTDKQMVKKQLLSLYKDIIEYQERGNTHIKVLINAIECNDRFSETKNEWADYHNGGINAFKQGDLKNAIKLFDLAIKKYPSAESYYNKGFVYSQLGDFKNEISSYTASILLDKNHINSNRNRGLSILDLLVKNNLINDVECNGLLNLARQDLIHTIQLGGEDARKYLKQSYTY